jgi:phosphoinositide-3-kinase regulatory subunit 4
VHKHLDGIENERLRALLASMLSFNPKERKAAEIYLDQERGKLFPEYFYSFLQSYIQMFSSIPILPNDDKINRLYSDISQIIKILTGQEDGQRIKPTNPEDDGLILVTTVVTASIRGLKHSSSKIYCLEILQQLAENTTSETILDRILPYIVSIDY